MLSTSQLISGIKFLDLKGIILTFIKHGAIWLWHDEVWILEGEESLRTPLSSSRCSQLHSSSAHMTDAEAESLFPHGTVRLTNFRDSGPLVMLGTRRSLSSRKSGKRVESWNMMVLFSNIYSISRRNNPKVLFISLSACLSLHTGRKCLSDNWFKFRSFEWMSSNRDSTDT